MSEEMLNTTNGIPISYVYWGDILIWPDGTPPAPVIYYSFSVSPTSITMTGGAQTVTVNVQTNSPSWQVLSYPSWMNLESSAQVDGSWVLTFSVEQNTGNTRNGSISFSYQSDSEGSTATTQVGVEQEMLIIYYTFSYTPTSLTMTYGEQNITVTATTDSPSWQVLSYPSWMNLESSAQVGGSWVLTFSVDENEGAIRTDNIVFQYQSDNVGTVSTAQMPMTQNKFFGIKYKSTNNSVVTPNVTAGYGANYVSNTYTSNGGRLEFDSDVTTIPMYAFSGKTTLYDITFPNTLETIGQQSFSACTSITSITIPDNVTSISSSTFRDCTALKWAYVGSGVTVIGGHSFRDDPALSSITIAGAITKIGNAAFYQCTALSAITFPTSLTTIEGNACNKCRSLNNIYYLGTKAQYSAISKGSGWHTSVPATKVHCSDGDANI